MLKGWWKFAFVWLFCRIFSLVTKCYRARMYWVGCGRANELGILHAILRKQKSALAACADPHCRLTPKSEELSVVGRTSEIQFWRVGVLAVPFL